MRALQVMLPGAFVVAALGVGAMASDMFVSAGGGVELAQTQTKQNRDNRQDARQGTRDDRQDNRGDRRDMRDDCRDAEGVVGADKRDCKQDTRQDGSSQDGSTQEGSSGG